MRKLFISMLTLAIFTIIFGTVTYAWITIATVNNIEGLSLSASTGDELEISTDGFHFSSTLDTTDLEEIFENVSLSDVTSADGITFYNGGLEEIALARANHEYVSFELWFRTTKKEKFVYLINNVSDKVSYDVSMDGTYVVSKGIDWKANIDFQYGENDFIKQGETKTYYAKDAIRIGFQEVVDKPYDQREENELRNLIFDPSKNQERGYGVSYGAYDYFIKNTHKLIELPEHIPKTVYELTSPLEDNPYQADNEDSLITKMQPTGYFNEEGEEIYQSKVVVNIWVEGWDADALDAILKDYVKIQLQFKSLSKVSV